MRTAILRFLVKYFDELLDLDLRIARLFGIPAPHTLSSYAYVVGGFWCKFIDMFFKWLINQDNHCQRDYERISREAEADQQKKP
jgi:hypothetical protein